MSDRDRIYYYNINHFTAKSDYYLFPCQYVIEQLFVCWLFCFRSSQSIGHGTSRPCHKRWACHFFPPMGRWAEVLCSNGKVWPVCCRVNFGCNIVIVFCNVAGKTIAGTTDTPTELSFNPLPKEAEIQFILSEIRHYLSPDVDGE